MNYTPDELRLAAEEDARVTQSGALGGICLAFILFIALLVWVASNAKETPGDSTVILMPMGDTTVPMVF